MKAHMARRLEAAATACGQTVPEYLIMHPEYRMSRRERKRLEGAVLLEAARRIEWLHEHSGDVFSW